MQVLEGGDAAQTQQLIERKVFTLVPKLKNYRLISFQWHLKNKLNPAGSLKKYKVCLVALGFTKREGIDYIETFSPSSRQESLKGFLSVNSHMDWEVLQMDAVGAFLYGGLDEEIYLSQPKVLWTVNNQAMYGV